MATRFAARLPTAFETSDLTQVALLALLPVADRYDPTQGPFWSYAQWRALGAMKDHVRRNWPSEVRRVPLDEIVNRLEYSRRPDHEDRLVREQRLAKLIGMLPQRHWHVTRLRPDFERKVMIQVSHGSRNCEIATSLHISPSAVGVHRFRAMRKILAAA